MEIYGCVKGHAYSTPPFKGSLANCEGGPPGTRWTYNVTRSPGALAAVARLPKRMANGPFPEPGNRALAALGLGVTGSSPELGTRSIAILRRRAKGSPQSPRRSRHALADVSQGRILERTQMHDPRGALTCGSPRQGLEVANRGALACRFFLVVGRARLCAVRTVGQVGLDDVETHGLVAPRLHVAYRVGRTQQRPPDSEPPIPRETG